MAYKQGEIVLVPFPYSDLSGSKRRPVLVVSNNLYNNSFLDIVVVAITSRTKLDSRSQAFHNRAVTHFEAV